MKKILILCIPVLLSACAGEHNDLTTWMQNEENKMVPKVDPLPPAQVFSPAEFKKADDPFKPRVIAVSPTSLEFMAEFRRAKEPLEAFTLDELNFVGMINDNGEPYVLITTKDGILHRAGIGNHLGTNFGVISKIEKDNLLVKEIYQESNGDWNERSIQVFIN